jgi:hypothetical protein
LSIQDYCLGSHGKSKKDTCSHLLSHAGQKFEHFLPAAHFQASKMGIFE